MDDFQKKYIEEAYEIIAALEQSILKLEQNSGDTEVVESIFRSLHTLKGGAAMFGFEKIRDASHELENAYDQIRSGRSEVTKSLLDITLEGIDYFKNLLEDNPGNKGDEYHEAFIDRVKKISEGQEIAAAPDASAGKEQETSGQDSETAPEATQNTNESQDDAETEQPENPSSAEGKTYYIFFRPNKDILKNGTNPLLLLEELAALGDTEVVAHTTDIPEFNELNAEELRISWTILLSSDQSREEAIADVFMFVEDDSVLDVHPISDKYLLNDHGVRDQFQELFETNPSAGLKAVQQLLAQDEIEDGGNVNATKENTSQDTSTTETNFSGKEVDEGDGHAIEAWEGTNPESDSRQNTAQSQPETPTVADSNSNGNTPSNDHQDAGASNTSQPGTTESTDDQKGSSKEGGKQNAISSIRISAEKVDELMNLVSELVTTQARLNLYAENQNNTELEDINEKIHKLTSQLRDNAFDLSLIPLQSIVTRFQRLVRDLSSQLGKEVNFVTEGTDTELDKSIIENLVDPVLHIIRNSIDHGIEDPETRKSLGKPEKGTIHLKAYHSGASVHIEVKDDGEGLDVDAIRQKGVDKGFISPQARLSNKEILNLIFIPGFSTNQDVTDVSGRGVGMDVVKDKISAIRGEIDLDATKHQGTTVTIKLPLTLSIIDGLLVYLADTKYLIPLNVVDKIYAIKHEDLYQSNFNYLVLDGQQVPYYDLRKEFGVHDEPPERQQVIVVTHEERRIGLVLDKVIGEYQAVLKPLGKLYRKLQIISGATILGDGTVALVMDTNKLINKYSNHQKQEVNYG